MSLYIAVDVGGTFTDAACLNTGTGEITTAKTSTTPGDFAAGVLTAVDRLGGRDVFDELTFASTIFINALVTGRLSRTALITTSGFRDVLEIGRGNRPDMYNLMYEKPKALIPRDLRFELDERVDHHGEVLVALNTAQLESLAARLISAGVEAVAIVFLHSYANPRHELEAKVTLQGLLGSGVPVVASSEVARLWLEYERAVSTAANAGLAPLAMSVFDELSRLLEDRAESLRAMRSNGGVASFEAAAQVPIHLVESGPAGGVIGTRAIGALLETRNVISFDVGGTTAKCSLISEGRLPYTLDYVLRSHDSYTAGYPLRTPTIDIVEIGAGGGSIAAVDVGGRLSVGPDSAGAHPGPVAYGLGGTQPTVTDACLLAGFIGIEDFAGGELTPAVDAAHDAVLRLADSMGQSPDSALAGIIALAQTKMANAVKLVSVKRGYDPRDFALVAFGGGGPIHACAVAEQLDMSRVVIPRFPSVFSAVGMLTAELREDAALTKLTVVSPDAMAEVTHYFAQLEEEALDRLRSLGLPITDASTEFSLDMRYVGQEHSVSVPITGSAVDAERLIGLFEAEHRRAYRFTTSDSVEIVHYRVVVHAPRGVELLQSRKQPVSHQPRSEPTRRSVLWANRWVEATVWDRDRLEHDSQVDGPAILRELGTSTFVPATWTATVLASGDLELIDQGRADRALQ